MIETALAVDAISLQALEYHSKQGNTGNHGCSLMKQHLNAIMRPPTQEHRTGV